MDKKLAKTIRGLEKYLVKGKLKYYPLKHSLMLYGLRPVVIKAIFHKEINNRNIPRGQVIQYKDCVEFYAGGRLMFVENASSVNPIEYKNENHE